MCEVTDQLDRTPKDKARVLMLKVRVERLLRRLDDLADLFLPPEGKDDEPRARHVG